VAFPKRLLTEGEELVVDARPHWIALVGAVVVTILIIAVESFILTHIHGGGLGRRILRWIVVGGGIVLFVIYPLR
jgi:VIT1/CCC1 family predicted Fe2+/Mn2+ transporter